MKILKLVLTIVVTLAAFVHLGYSRALRVAWLAPGPETGRAVNSYTSVNALKLALSSVSANPNILNGHTVEVKHFKTDCTSQGTMSMVLAAQKSYNPDVIIGPPCAIGLKIVAQLASFWNIPVFTWNNAGVQFDNSRTYRTLIRMIPSLSIIGDSLRHVFQTNNWTKFVFLHDATGAWPQYGGAVRSAIQGTNIQMVNTYELNTSMTDRQLLQMFQQIKKEAWIVVFAVPFDKIRRYMLLAGQAGLANGNYVFVQLDHEMHSDHQIRSAVLSNGRWKFGDSNDPAARQAYQSLIHIVTDPMNDDDTSPAVKVPRNRFDEFARLAATETHVQKPGWLLPNGGPVDTPSLYLYDAVLVWAVLADKLLANAEDPKDGKQMARRATNFMADGATGYISISNNLARDGKTFVLSMDQFGNFVPYERLKYNGTHGYSQLRLRPMDELILRQGGGQNEIRNLPSPAIQMPNPSPTMAIPPTTVATTTAGTTLPPPVAMPIPQPPSNAVSMLLAKVQALEKKIKEHEFHSHLRIPDHTHTPAPESAVTAHTHTPPAIVSPAANKVIPVTKPTTAKAVTSTPHPVAPVVPKSNAPVPKGISVPLVPVTLPVTPPATTQTPSTLAYPMPVSMQQVPIVTATEMSVGAGPQPLHHMDIMTHMPVITRPHNGIRAGVRGRHPSVGFGTHPSVEVLTRPHTEVVTMPSVTMDTLSAIASSGATPPTPRRKGGKKGRPASKKNAKGGRKKGKGKNVPKPTASPKDGGAQPTQPTRPSIFNQNEYEGSSSGDAVMDQLTGLITGSRNASNIERSIVRDWLSGMEELPALMLGLSWAERQQFQQRQQQRRRNNMRNRNNRNNRRTFFRDSFTGPFDSFITPTTNNPWANQRTSYTTGWW